MNIQLLTAILTLANAATVSDNLLQDGNFATGPLPQWTNLLNIASVTQASGDGVPAPSAEIQPSSLASFIYQCVPIQAGNVYQLSGSVELASLSAAPPSSPIGFVVGFFTTCSDNNANIGPFVGATIDADQLTVGVWNKVQTRGIMAPSGKTQAMIMVGTTDTSQTFIMRADTVFFGADDVIFYDEFEND